MLELLALESNQPQHRMQVAESPTPPLDGTTSKYIPISHHPLGITRLPEP